MTPLFRIPPAGQLRHRAKEKLRQRVKTPPEPPVFACRKNAVQTYGFGGLIMVVSSFFSIFFSAGGFTMVVLFSTFFSSFGGVTMVVLCSTFFSPGVTTVVWDGGSDLSTLTSQAANAKPAAARAITG